MPLLVTNFLLEKILCYLHVCKPQWDHIASIFMNELYGHYDVGSKTFINSPSSGLGSVGGGGGVEISNKAVKIQLLLLCNNVYLC